ncbi:MAG: AsmA family protein [Elusimicrobiales bacterium]|nr:AsmA family protein [Elusimicrobiales bacterium]
MTPHRKIILSGAAVLVLLALAWARLSLVPGEAALKRRVEAEVSAALHMEVTVGGKIRLGLFPRAQLTLGDITVKAAEPRFIKIIKIEKARIWLELRPLLRREVRIARAELDGLSLQLVHAPRPGTGKPGVQPAGRPFTVKELRISRGSVAYAGLEPGRDVKASGIELTAKDLYYGTPPGEAQGRKLFFNGDLKCESLSVGSGVKAAGLKAAISDFSYLDPAGSESRTLFLKGEIKCRTFALGGDFEADGIEAAAKNLSYTFRPGVKTGRILFYKGDLKFASIKAGVKTQASGAGLAEGEISYSFDPAGKPYRNLSLRGSLKFGEVKAGGLDFTGVDMKASAEKGIFSAGALQADFLGGRGSGDLKADLSSAVPVYAANYTLTGTRLEVLLGSFAKSRNGPEPMEGLADWSADITARGSGAGELFGSMKGRVALTGKDLVLHNMDLDAVISKLERSQNFNLLDAGAFLLAGPLGPAVTKSYNFVDLGFSRGKDGKISRLASVWKLENGSAVTEDVAMATLHYRLAMEGRLDFAGLRFDGMTAAILDKRGCAAYSQKINGTLAHPKMGKLSMLESLAGPVLSVLGTIEKLVPGMECKPFYSGSIPQPEK